MIVAPGKVIIHSDLIEIDSFIFKDDGKNSGVEALEWAQTRIIEKLKKLRSDTERSKLNEIEKQLDKTFKRNMMADDDDEVVLLKEVHALEDAVRQILDYLNSERR